MDISGQTARQHATEKRNREEQGMTAQQRTPLAEKRASHASPHRRLKIAFVSPYDWSYHGGVKSHILHLAAELERMGHRAHILTSATGKAGRVTEPHVTKLGWAAPIPWNGSIARIAVSPQLARQTRDVLEREQFDVVHLHEPFAPALPLTTMHVLKGLPTVSVGTFHAFSPHTLVSMPRFAYSFARPFLRRYFNRLSGHIAVSPSAQRFISRYFPGSYELIPNGVDLHRFSVQAAPLPQFQDGKHNILYLGRMEPRKWLPYLLQAIPQIRASYPNTRFIIASDGPQRAKYEQLVQQQGWPDVVFTGFVSNEELPRYYASCTVYCAPSTGSESQGVVLLEAMASNKAVVASNIDGYRDVIEDGAEGVLVPPRDSAAIAHAICRLLGDDALRAAMGARGRQRAGEYSWPRLASRIVEYYQSLIERQTWLINHHEQTLPSDNAERELRISR
jgi:phosphatidylinositol alpha-mannosyltransferase